MRRELVRAVMLAGVLFVVVGTLFNQRQLWPLPLAHLATRARAGTDVALAAISQRIQLAPSHATSAQLVEGAGVAWFFFVLALVLLARSGQAEMLGNESPVPAVRILPAGRYESKHSDTAALADPAAAYGAPLRRSSGQPVYPHPRASHIPTAGPSSPPRASHRTALAAGAPERCCERHIVRNHSGQPVSRQSAGGANRGPGLGLSLSGAKSRVQRAREKLRSLLLACCHLEFDHAGRVIDYHPNCSCCTGCSTSAGLDGAECGSGGCGGADETEACRDKTAP